MAINTAVNLAIRNYNDGFSIESVSGQKFQLTAFDVRLIAQQNTELTLPNLAAATLFANEQFDGRFDTRLAANFDTLFDATFNDNFDTRISAQFDSRFDATFDDNFDARLSDRIDDALATQFTAAGDLLIGTANGAYKTLHKGSEGQLLGIFGGTVSYSTVQQTPLEPPSVQPTASGTMMPNMRYICANASQITLTLPATATVNQVLSILNVSGGVKIAQAAGQRVQIGVMRSTAGTAGYVRTTADGDSLNMVYVGGGLWFANGAPQGAWQNDVDDDAAYLTV